MLFLIRYNRNAGRLESIESFEDGDRFAVSEARLSLELELFRSGSEDEVVVLEAVDETAIRTTHRRYFEDIRSLALPPSVVRESPPSD
jgi:hypothetical protein